MIAMVIAQDTDYILLDEPTNNLDIYHASNMMKMVRRLCDELGKTVILVLHEINFHARFTRLYLRFCRWPGSAVRHGAGSHHPGKSDRDLRRGFQDPTGRGPAAVDLLLTGAGRQCLKLNDQANHKQTIKEKEMKKITRFNRNGFIDPCGMREA